MTVAVPGFVVFKNHIDTHNLGYVTVLGWILRTPPPVRLAE
jgi:hypothetical protein